MITAFTGLPGHGKTYMMTKMAIKHMKKGGRVFANYPLKGAIRYQQITELFDVRRLPGEKLAPLICIDEAGLVAPAGGWKSIPFDVMAHWRQHRHAGVNIVYTAQDLRDVAVPLRRVTQFVRECSKFLWWFSWHEYNPTNKKRYGRGIMMFDPTIGQHYDTHAEDVTKQDYLEGL